MIKLADLNSGVDADAFNSSLAEAAALLHAGGVVAFPTETVYGLGADAENDGAVRRIFGIKGRPADHPLIVHLADPATLDRWAREIPAAALRLAERFWPGPLTIVLRRSRIVSDLVTGGLDTVGIRVPAHPVAQGLLRAFQGGIAAPSANRFGRISPTSADHVREELGSAPDLILDGGDCRVGLESTIISLAEDRPILLRPGDIALSELHEAVGREVALPRHPDPKLRAPGSHASHYAPLTPTALIPARLLQEELDGLPPDAPPVAVLCMAEAITAASPSLHLLRMPADPAAYGRILYASLRRLDGWGFSRILIEAPPDAESWRAVNDRLRRAATRTVHNSPNPQGVIR